LQTTPHLVTLHKTHLDTYQVPYDRDPPVVWSVKYSRQQNTALNNGRLERSDLGGIAHNTRNGDRAGFAAAQMSSS